MMYKATTYPAGREAGYDVILKDGATVTKRLRSDHYAAMRFSWSHTDVPNVLREIGEQVGRQVASLDDAFDALSEEQRKRHIASVSAARIAAD